MPPGSGNGAPAVSAESAQSSSGGNQGAWKDREPPPAYDGKNPEKTFAKWLKELKLWEFETEVPKAKWGAKLLRQLTGPARAAADGLTFEEVACEKGMENVLAVLKEHFAPHLETSLPKAMESAIYGEVRNGKEGFAEYVIRMEHAFKELEGEGVKLPPIAAGYIMYRHANLTEVQDNQLVTWCEGKYDRAVIVKNLRKLEKVVHDKKKIYFGEEGDEDGMPPDGEDNEVFATTVDSAAEYESDEDDDYVYVSAGELQDVYDEEEMQEALATYQEVRRSLRDQRNARGFYPVEKGKGKAKGGGFGKGKGRPMMAPRSRDRVKFSGGKGNGHSKVHVDMLKLRMRCARCGCIGHWARECRNPPDDRGRQNMPTQFGKGGTSSSSASARSGFFVSARGPPAESSQTFFGRVCENEESSARADSYVPLFDHVMNAVCRKRARSTSQQPQTRVGSGKEADPVSFVGVTTSSTEGIVDTAAQDGLIGKPAMLRLVEELRRRGMKIRWNGKRAQATGVGGKATVIGVVEAPVGIAGINGLLEMTVVQEDIPMLLPIKLLRQLRAVVDLDQNVLELRKYDTQARLSELPSGHVAVDVMSFDPSGWSVPREAESAKLSTEQFTLINCSFVNQSMISLEKTICEEPLPLDLDNGTGAAPQDDGAAGAGSAKDPTRAEATNADGGPAKDTKGSATLEGFRRQAVQPHDVHRGLRPRRSLAARFLATAVAASMSTGPVSFYPVLEASKFQGCHREPAGICPDYKVCAEACSPEVDFSTYGGPGELQPSGDLPQGRWQPIQPGCVLRPVQGPLEASESDRACGGDGADDFATDFGDQVHMRHSSSPVASEEGRANSGPSLLPVPEEGVRVLHVGPGGAEEAGCTSEPVRASRCGDGNGGRTEAELGDCQASEGGGTVCGRAEGGDRGQVRAETGANSEWASTRSGPAPAATPAASSLDAVVHGPSEWRLRDGASTTQPVMGCELPPNVAPEMCCHVSSESQMLTARRLQMRALCPSDRTTPWSMPASRVYYKKAHGQSDWTKECGWLPRAMEPDVCYLVIFEDQGSMIMWSEDFGKVKALPNGKFKQLKATTEKFIQAWHTQKFGKVWEFGFTKVRSCRE